MGKINEDKHMLNVLRHVMADQLKERMYAVAPHASWHCILLC